jgi:hypothetical protein
VALCEGLVRGEVEEIWTMRAGKCKKERERKGEEKSTDVLKSLGIFPRLIDRKALPLRRHY